MAMTPEPLTAWLERPVYEQGVLLYRQFIGEDFLFRLFSQGADDYNREQLRSALEKKLAELLAEEKAKKEAYPESLKEELVGGGPLMNERILIKERLRNFYNQGVTESPELKALAFRVLTIKDELDRIYGRRDFFEQNGFLPEAASLPEASSPADLLKRRNSVRTYVTKYKKELAETFEPKRLAKVTAKLNWFQNELADLDTQLTHLYAV